MKGKKPLRLEALRASEEELERRRKKNEEKEIIER